MQNKKDHTNIKHIWYGEQQDGSGHYHKALRNNLKTKIWTPSLSQRSPFSLPTTLPHNRFKGETGDHPPPILFFSCFSFFSRSELFKQWDSRSSGFDRPQFLFIKLLLPHKSFYLFCNLSVCLFFNFDDFNDLPHILCNCVFSLINELQSSSLWN